MTKLIGLYLFGSAARGDCDQSSDVDVLAVYDEQPDSPLRNKVLSAVRAKLGNRVTLAEYTSRRLREMFDCGHLFSWHLYQEAKPLQMPDLLAKQSYEFECPAPYMSSIEDAQRFVGLLSSVRTELQNESCSLVHEAGLVYLALRNIAMSLSMGLQDKADFARSSPLTLSVSLAIPAPCSTLEFEVLVAARHASQRGLPSPKLDWERLSNLLDRSLGWAHMLLEKTNGRK